MTPEEEGFVSGWPTEMGSVAAWGPALGYSGSRERSP